MVATKTCEKCGWLYPITHPEKSCRFCGTPFKKRFCSKCGQYTQCVATALCRPCESKRVMAATSSAQSLAKAQRYTAKIRKQREDNFNEWLSMIAKVPKPIRTLVQDEWIRTCIHFEKCAVCKNESIDARAFFIHFSLGGRYAEWNVIPVCERCAITLRRPQNPFVSYPDNVMTVVKYLKPILERAVQHEKNI